jgi:DNA-binding response OmpR family regulator
MADLLIVDDDEDIAAALGDILECEGHRVRLAHDGIEGLRCLREGRPDAILLDVEMPRLTGPQMAYEIFLRDAGDEFIPIVLLSGKLDLDCVATAVGTPYYLAKPYPVSELLALLDRALGERMPPRPRFAAAVAHP